MITVSQALHQVLNMYQLKYCFQNLYEVCALTIPVLQISKLRQRKV